MLYIDNNAYTSDTGQVQIYILCRVGSDIQLTTLRLTVGPILDDSYLMLLTNKMHLVNLKKSH